MTKRFGNKERLYDARRAKTLVLTKHGGSDTVDGGTDLTGLGTDNHVARWDGTDTLQDSSVTIDDSGNLDLTAAAAQFEIEGDHALSLEDGSGNRTNVVSGTGALTATGSNSVISGRQAAYNVTPVNSIVIGAYGAYDGNQGGHGSNPDKSVLAGYYVGYSASDLRFAVALGAEALLGDDYNNIYPDARYSVVAGFRAAQSADTFTYSVAAGAYAGDGADTSHSVMLGYKAGSGLSTDNILIIENSDDITTPLIYGEFDNNIVTLYADTAETTAIHDLLTLSHATSGTAAALFGVTGLHELEDAAGNAQTASEAATLWADATSDSESPLRRWTTYPEGSAGPGYAGFWTWNGIADTSITVIPNGAGDVTGIIQINYAVLEVTGAGTSAGTANITPGNTSNIYTDGTDTLTVSVAANGSMTISRTAGSDTFKVSLFMNWV